jgi:hypothetical protein
LQAKTSGAQGGVEAYSPRFTTTAQDLQVEYDDAGRITITVGGETWLPNSHRLRNSDSRLWLMDHSIVKEADYWQFLAAENIAPRLTAPFRGELISAVVFGPLRQLGHPR